MDRRPPLPRPRRPDPGKGSADQPARRPATPHHTGTDRLNWPPKSHAIERTLTPRLWTWPRPCRFLTTDTTDLHCTRELLPHNIAERCKAHRQWAAGASSARIAELLGDSRSVVQAILWPTGALMVRAGR